MPGTLAGPTDAPRASRQPCAPAHPCRTGASLPGTGVPGRLERPGTPVSAFHRSRSGKDRAYLPGPGRARAGPVRTCRNRAYLVGWNDQVRPFPLPTATALGRTVRPCRNRASLPKLGVAAETGAHPCRTGAYLPKPGVPGRLERPGTPAPASHCNRSGKDRASLPEPGVPAGTGRTCRTCAYLPGTGVPGRLERPDTPVSASHRTRSGKNRAYLPGPGVPTETGHTRAGPVRTCRGRAYLVGWDDQVRPFPLPIATALGRTVQAETGQSVKITPTGSRFSSWNWSSPRPSAQ
ncbi:hypothetical protein EDF23_101608 [Curtobacterium sp. PhB128]|nr:hypothetical protein EDF23_101608 [Curtobacterium sp. PhB128]TCL99285.1 hypothetical protein EDF29_101609 [Curtobacterium sp. PhB138]